MTFIESLWSPLAPIVPSGSEWLLGLGVGLLVSVPARWLVITLHRQGWRVGDTRKIFHLVIFTAAALLRMLTTAGTLSAMSLVVVGMVLWCVWRRHSVPLYKALARPSDAPHEAWHVLVPMICTGVGGILAQLLAGPQAFVVYLIAGWGDAVGEPVGVRWGKHRYRVPRLDGVISERSWEGSTAVFVASLLAALIGLSAIPGLDASLLSSQRIFLSVLILGIVATVLEAGSPHGYDNLILQVGLALTLRWL